MYDVESLKRFIKLDVRFEPTIQKNVSVDDAMSTTPFVQVLVWY